MVPVEVWAHTGIEESMSTFKPFQSKNGHFQCPMELEQTVFEMTLGIDSG